MARIRLASLSSLPRRLLKRLHEDWTQSPARRYFISAVLISIACHGIALALHFTTPSAKRPPLKDAGLEVILLNAGSQSVPSEAQLLAQVSSNGGGDAQSGRAKSPLERSPQNRKGELLAELRERQAALEKQQRLLAAQLAQRSATPPPLPDAPPGLPSHVPVHANSRAEQLTRQFAEIADRIEDYNKRPRKHFFAPSTSEYRFATYVEQWRRRIETVGNRNYPAAARGKTYGSLRMTVYIRSDGSIESLDIDRPSDHKILNDAARRIVALSAPFAPFPPQIARDTDILAITRTWYFTNDTLTAKPG